MVNKMIIYQVELSAQSSEVAFLCQRREGIGQLSWRKMQFKTNKKEDKESLIIQPFLINDGE